jgi:hypothetical protein
MAARTLKTIYDEMIAEKQTFSYLNELQPNIDSYQTLLQSLTSKSRVAVWRLIIYLTALAIWTHEKLMDVQTKEIEQRAADVIPGVVRWYRDVSLLWQDGDALIWDGKKYVYSPININNRLVEYAASLEVNNQVIVKVAKDNGSGVPAALSAAEKARFETYLNLVKYAGVNTTVISDPADSVNITAVIFYDPLVIDSNGLLIEDGVTYPIEDAINDYVYSLGATNFNGKFRIIDLVDKLQAARGFKNVQFNAIATTSPAVADILATAGGTYQSVAGHMAVGTLTLTYTAA